MKLRILRNPAVLFSVLLVLIIACGSSATATSAPVTQPTAKPSGDSGPAPTAMPEPEVTTPTLTVALDMMNFSHQDATVAAGITLVWTNQDGAGHTTTDTQGL